MSWRVAGALALVCVAGACEKVTSENIQKWRETQKGPAKLEKAFQDRELDPRLRAEAAAALVDIDLHLKVLAGWKALPEADRSKIAQNLIPLYGGQIATGTKLKARDARDALFEIREGLTGEQLAQADQALVKAIENDLRAGTVTEGRHTTQKIATQLGANAVAPAVEAVLQDPAPPFAPTVDLVAQLKDPALKQRAGAALAKRAKAKADQPAPYWAALVTLGGQQATEMLKATIRTAPEAQAVAAAQALKASKPGPEILPLALELAGDAKLVPAAREEMFALVETIGASALDGLTKLIAAETQESGTRYRAFAAALAVGKAKAVDPALRALPAGASYAPEHVTNLLAKPIAKLGEEGREPALAALEAPAPAARLAGVLALEEIGTPEDAKALAKCARDRATPNGFPRGATVGKEAARVAAALKSGKAVKK